MNRNRQLELIWIGEGNSPRLEPRIVLEDQEELCHAGHHMGDRGILDNQLDLGDNLLAPGVLEGQRSSKRRALFDAQDEIDHRREQLIDEIEGKLNQRATLTEVLPSHWRLE
jgi:hypothetical protein